jgi:phenylacetic acid degradation operon negative regulatory protein
MGPEPGLGRRVTSSPLSRTVMVTFLGSIVRRMGGWMPIAGTVDLLTQFGLDAPGIRTAVFRLKQRGWLVAESRDGRRGYALTPVALAALATGDEVIWHARQPADINDGWCIVNFSVPESARAKRYQLRAHLASLGFGNVGTAMWLAPARMRDQAEQAIGELGLDKHAAVFVGDYVGGQDLSTLLYESWDLAAIDRRYVDFVDRFQHQVSAFEHRDPDDPDDPVDPELAFVTYLGIVDQWRKLPFRDPGLPRELLADDWSAPKAVALFERLVALLEDRALAHAASCW